MEKCSVLYGPPGTGKTRTLIELSRGYEDPLFMTFTRAGAEEVMSRVDANSTTIHAFCFKEIGMTRAQVVDQKKLNEFGQLMGYTIRVAHDEESMQTSPGSMMYSLNQLAKASQLPLSKIYEIYNPYGVTYEMLTHFVDTFERWKQSFGYMDFNDMLDRFTRMEYDNPISLLAVDEAQDLSELQWRVVRKLMGNADEIIIAGDDDQCIHEWAGSDPHGMAKFEDKYATDKMVLEESHRVPEIIHHLSTDILSKISTRVEKKYRPAREKGEIERVNTIQSAHINGEKTFILYRGKWLRREVEDHLIRTAVPFSINGGISLFDSKIANAVRYLKMFKDGKKLTDKQLEFTYKHLNGYFTVMVDGSGMDVLKKFDPLDVLELNYEQKNYFNDVDLFAKSHITLSTIHSSKGMEADHIVLMNGMGSSGWYLTDDSEHRVWYTGVTRSKKKLTIVDGDMPYDLTGTE